MSARSKADGESDFICQFVTVQRAEVEALEQTEHPPPAMDSNGTNPVLLFVLMSTANARESDSSATL